MSIRARIKALFAPATPPTPRQMARERAEIKGFGSIARGHAPVEGRPAPTVPPKGPSGISRPEHCDCRHF